MLNCINIKGYKSIKDINLELRSLNVFIGANGAGKSNLISLFYLIDRMIEKSLQLYVGQSGGADAILYFGQKVTDRMSVKLDFGKNGYEFALAPTRDDRLIFAGEDYFYREAGDNQAGIVSLGNGQKEALLPDEAEKNPGSPAAHVLETVKNRRVYHFHDTGDSAKMKQFCNINDNFFLKTDAANLAAYLFLLQETHNAWGKKLACPVFFSSHWNSNKDKK